MRKILISGGPVHANLDAVKIITNKFKGGLMLKLAEELASHNTEVTYLCSRQSKLPKNIHYIHHLTFHEGFDDYRLRVNTMAPEMDAVILGGAVANLIPVNPWKGKFPSHNYKAGDIIPIDFTIAPRVIDEAKNNMKAGAHLFGFKLLSGVKREELIDAAYEVLTGSGATAVFANDAKDIMRVHAVTKERAIHTLARDEIMNFVLDRMNEQYYRTQPTSKAGDAKKECKEDKEMLKKVIEKNKDKFTKVDDYQFGCIAIRTARNTIVTTGRGKKELDDVVEVINVDHTNRVIYADKKATLNAPLLHKIFKDLPDTNLIMHFHHQIEGLETVPYACPGTFEDSYRKIKGPFNIENHGCFLTFPNVE